MILRPQKALSESDREFALKEVIKDGIASEGMVALSGGAFLVALALNLGASNLVVGFLAAIPPLGNLFQIAAVFLVERVQNRRLIAVLSAAASRSMWLVVAAIPFLSPSEIGLAILLSVLLLRSVIVPFTSVAWNSWIKDIVPPTRFGSFFSRRMRLSVGTGMILSLGAGFFLDWWKDSFPSFELRGYSLLFLMASLSGLIGVYFLSRTPEPKMVSKEKSSFLSTLGEPFRDENFKNLIHFSGAWNFAANLAAPFFTVYMLRRLGFSLSLVIVLGVVSQLTHIAFLRIWGIFTDKFNNKSVLTACSSLFMLAVLGWTFTTLPEEYFLTLPLLAVLHVLMGISVSGVNLASGNIGFKLAPEGKATSYLAARNIINSFCSAIGPVLGGLTADFFAQQQLSLSLTWTTPRQDLVLQPLNLQHWDFFFVSAFLIGLYAIRRLALVAEEGDINEKELLQQVFLELGKDVKSFSTMGGLRYMSQFVKTPGKYTKSFIKRKNEESKSGRCN